MKSAPKKKIRTPKKICCESFQSFSRWNGMEWNGLIGNIGVDFFFRCTFFFSVHIFFLLLLATFKFCEICANVEQSNIRAEAAPKNPTAKISNNASTFGSETFAQETC